MSENDILIVKNNDGINVEIKVIDVLEADNGVHYLYYEISGISGRFISSVEIEDDEYYLSDITPEEKEIVEKALLENNSADELLGGDLFEV